MKVIILDKLWSYFWQSVLYVREILGFHQSYKLATLTMPNDIRFIYRKNTTDADSVRGVWDYRTYNPPGFDIEEGDIVVDIGAHIGAFTVFAAKSFGKVKVIAFEPHPLTFNLLIHNIKINDCDNVHANNLALSNFSGQSHLYINLYNVGASHLYRRRVWDFVKPRITVKVTTLQQLFIDNAITIIDFLKMDCEGAEWEIMTSGETCLSRIRKIVLEFHEQRGYSAQQLSRLLRKYGFDVTIKRTKPRLGYLYAKNRSLM